MDSNFQEKIDALVSSLSPTILKQASQILSSTYREKHSSQSIFSNEAQTLSYLAARFPATFAATSYVLKELLAQIPHFSCEKLLDLGAGPATASLAALSTFPKLSQITLIEKSLGAIALGKQLLSDGEWICKSLQEMTLFPDADLAIAAYCLNEIHLIEPILEALWKSDVKTIAIIEPGTPAGYKTILRARNQLLSLGGSILAPCPHAKACPLKSPDWCHFSTRLERTKLHKLLKGGSLGFEDEKFSYLIVTKKNTSPPTYSRILRHPGKGSGHVRLNLCTERGTQEERVVSRKEGDLYRNARDAKWGDSINCTSS